MEKIYQPQSKDAIAICMCCDENYLPYASTTIASISRHADPTRNYQIFILYDKLRDSLKHKVLYMQKYNIKIEFINITPYIQMYKHLFHTHGDFTESVYYRFFIPIIFSNFNKVLYCDCDGLFVKDCKDIYDLGGEGLVAAVRDIWMEIKLKNYPDVYGKYFKETLRLNNIHNYFNSGLMLFNIKKCIRFNLIDKCIQKLQEIKSPWWVDQCIFNAVCQDRVVFLPLSCNVLINLIVSCEDVEKQLSPTDYKEYLYAINNPIYLHFASFQKPWKSDSDYSFFFWENAKSTPFYENLLIDLLDKRFIIPLQERINCIDERFIPLQKQINVLDEYFILLQQRVDRLESWSLRENIKKMLKYLLPKFLYQKIKEFFIK